jgi:hypothetical protein
MTELLDVVASWPTLLAVVVIFGFAPGFCLRLIVLAYPRNDPRRAELIAELYAVPRIHRPLWVAEQLEVALFEGLRRRVSAATQPLIARSNARRLERNREAHMQQLARRVEETLVRCGLCQSIYSVSSGSFFQTPQVVSVSVFGGSTPVRLNIRTLPGQLPDDFAAHARRIAYFLDMAEVRVTPLGPGLIRLDLLPAQPDPHHRD